MMNEWWVSPGKSQFSAGYVNKFWCWILGYSNPRLSENSAGMIVGQRVQSWRFLQKRIIWYCVFRFCCTLMPCCLQIRHWKDFLMRDNSKSAVCLARQSKGWKKKWLLPINNSRGKKHSTRDEKHSCKVMKTICIQAKRYKGVPICMDRLEIWWGWITWAVRPIASRGEQQIQKNKLYLQLHSNTFMGREFEVVPR